MTEVVSLIVTAIIGVIVYETFKPQQDYKSTNHQYDKEDTDD
jgi:hypothetical protein